MDGSNLYVFWVAATLIVMVMAANRDRNPIGWGILAACFPPMAMLLLVMMGEDEPWIDDYTYKGKSHDSAYKASLSAGNPPEIAIEDGRASTKRINASYQTRRRYNSDELEPPRVKKNSQKRW